MRKTIKLLLWLFAGTGSLLAVLVALLLLVDVNVYRAQIEQRVSAAFGRDVIFAGPLSLEPSLKPRFAVNGVKITNPDWASRRWNYTLAWGLVYYLRKGAPVAKPPKYAHILDTYAEALWESQDPEQATETAFEGVDMDAYREELTRFWKSTSRRGAARREWSGGPRSRSARTVGPRSICRCPSCAGRCGSWRWPSPGTCTAPPTTGRPSQGLDCTGVQVWLDHSQPSPQAAACRSA